MACVYSPVFLQEDQSIVRINDRESLEGHIGETARRLRLIQVDFADDSQQTRMEYLHEEIERALKTVLPELREAFLEELMSRFPAGYFGTAATEALSPHGQGQSEGGELDRDPEVAVRCLLEMAATLAADQKEGMAVRLQEAGFGARPASHDDADDLSEDLRTKLQLGDGPAIKAQRLEALAVLLTDFAFKLEPLVWNTWRTLAPRSSVQPPRGLRKTVGQFLTDDSPALDQKVERELKMLQRLVAAIITAVGGVGKQFAKSHLSRYSPSEISNLVRMERGGMLVSHEVKCWRKYFELAETLTEDTMEMELRKAIADYAESLIKGLD